MIGRALSHYRITAKLGEGGMGEVYLAEDTKLDREVALKILPETLAADPERLGRFEREAKTVAALNHPNIVTIYSVEADDGRHFLTMELVEGKTLDHHIPADGLPLAKLFDLAIPIADALAEAHAKGITHRDLKPANVMVSEKGQVKILDFGLAKLAEGGTGGETGETAALTQDGLVVGTVRYMSPEQARGEPADHRSDVFSLGVLLYEMATGKRPFQGNSSIELLSSILKDEAPFTYIGIGDVEGARRIAKRVLSFPDLSDVQICFTHLVDLYLLGDTRPMVEFLRARPDADLGTHADLPFLIPLFERRYDDALAVLETLPDPIVAQFGVSPHSYVRARVLHAQGRIDVARSQAELAVQELTGIAATMPENARPIVARALMQAILGNETAARADARLATELYPVERDALSGPNYVADGLRALAVFIDSEELAEKLDRYLALESKVYYVDYLLLDPVFDRHRDHPSIRALQEKHSLRNGPS